MGFASQSTCQRVSNPGDYSLYRCTSWCKFPVYDADFGWGKPVWITVPEFPWKNMILLMDSRDGEGIEAMVSLEKKEMEVFEKNQELLSFCQEILRSTIVVPAGERKKKEGEEESDLQEE
ncbi:unnamed protein product [Citrullus colocynthis]|uniref:Uncharacterized protein n=1 Tax=Citrullus colocynthis TaxID=252529 RepID=A0ABP0YPC9_9ROSI